MARLKQVFRDADEVAHVWAQQTQNFGRTSTHNVYFRGRTIYSYGEHFPLASFLDTPKGRVILINSRTYSTSTSRHQSSARSAVWHSSMDMFRIPLDERDRHGISPADFHNYVHRVLMAEKPEEGYYADIYTKRVQDDHDYLRKHWEKIIADSLERAANKRVKPENREAAANHAKAMVENMRRWCVLWDLDWKLPNLDDQEEFFADIKRRAEEEAERIEAERLERQRKELEALEERRKRDAEEWQLWREGKRRDCPGSWAIGGDKITVYHGEEGDEVVTSRGASVPLDHALRAWPIILMAYKLGRAGKPKGDQGFRMGYYTLDSIAKDGTLEIGCHRIPKGEVLRVARLLGLETP